ncbi:hypothetical protein KW790_03115 [Candidatus Parcubacteria bacterium]|nr:hypothetical protein [Candidatus Parcubacteria bacterium]
MKSFQNNAGIIITVILVVIVVFSYKTFFQSDVTQNDVTAEGVGKTVVDLYSGFQSVTLDTSLFSDSNYRALIDFTALGVPVTSQPVGRNNPFDRITP